MGFKWQRGFSSVECIIDETWHILLAFAGKLWFKRTVDETLVYEKINGGYLL